MGYFFWFTMSMVNHATGNTLAGVFCGCVMFGMLAVDVVRFMAKADAKTSK